MNRIIQQRIFSERAQCMSPLYTDNNGLRTQVPIANTILIGMLFITIDRARSIVEAILPNKVSTFICEGCSVN